MNYLYAALAGIIQGLTEFLPVSSSGHLVLFHDILKFEFSDNLYFDVITHAGTLFALLLFFRADVLRLFRAGVRSLRHWEFRTDPDQRLAWFLVLATVPAAVAGDLLESFVGGPLRHPIVVATALAAGAGLFFAAERFAAKTRALASMRPAEAALIGVAQVLSLIPGVSRSGITIVAGLGLGYRREEAVRFTLLLSIPTVLGAAVKKGLEAGYGLAANIPVLAVGFIAALIAGILTIRLFMKFVGLHSLNVFAWYRLGLSVLVFLWLLAQ